LDLETKLKDLKLKHDTNIKELQTELVSKKECIKVLEKQVEKHEETKEMVKILNLKLKAKHE
jgi:hypothetical protein